MYNIWTYIYIVRLTTVKLINIPISPHSYHLCVFVCVVRAPEIIYCLSKFSIGNSIF